MNGKINQEIGIAKRNYPDLDREDLMTTIHSLEETGKVIWYSKFDSAKGQQRIYLQWAEGDTTRTEQNENR
jgi:hypothetical protein